MANHVSCGLKCNEEKPENQKLILTKFDFTYIIGAACGSVIFFFFFFLLFFLLSLLYRSCVFGRHQLNRLLVGT